MGALTDLPGVTVHDLYEAYPDLDIDAAHEQALLAAHDAFVWQHPFYWYSTPAILKEWQDIVLAYGWAYGPGGTALAGKRFLQAVSTGGAKEAYGRDGRNRFTVEELLAPVDATMHLCGVERLPPFVVHGANRLAPTQIDDAAAAWRARVAALVASLGGPT
jgi:glutathione-regulated potassium-efflux system ancillary protein KefG